MRSDRAAIAAGLLPGDELHRSLLRSIVDVARAIFRARAASVFLLDGETDELVFEAVSGEGEESLVGRRFPSSTGVAGWVLVTGQSLVLDDVSADPRFASQAAESTGYVPKAIMAVPLVSGERTLGVLEVLDRPSGERFTMEEADLLGMFATQAAVALDLLERSRSARRLLAGGAAGDGSVAHPARDCARPARDPATATAALELVRAVERLVSRIGLKARRGRPRRPPPRAPSLRDSCRCASTSGASSDALSSRRPYALVLDVRDALEFACATYHVGLIGSLGDPSRPVP